VHTIGSAKLENSGYEGSWSSAEDKGKFNNQFYHNAVLRGWAPEKAVNGNPGKNQWKLVDQGQGGEHKEMMFNTDLCLAYAKNDIEKCIKEYKWAKDEPRNYRLPECRFN